MGVRENSIGGNTQYFRISGGGVLYQSSKDPKEGYEKHINDKTKAVSYWRTFWNGIEGYLTGIYKTEAEYNGTKIPYLSIRISDEEGNYVINVQLFTPNKKLNSYAKSLVRYLPNIDIKRKIVINPAHAKKGEQFAPGNFFISYARETPEGRDELIQQYYKNGQNGWPDRVESADITGNKVFDYTAQDKFAYDELKKFIEMFAKNDNLQGFQQKNGQDTSQTPPPPSYQPEEAATTAAAHAQPFGAAVSNQQAYQQPPQYPPFGPEADDLPF